MSVKRPKGEVAHTIAFAAETFRRQRPFRHGRHPTCHEGKRRCAADGATPQAGGIFTLRLTAVMLMTEAILEPVPAA